MAKHYKPFEVIEHTADIGLKIYGRDLRELFLNAGKGLLSLMVDLDKVDSSRQIEVGIEEENKEELLVSWLNELIFQFSAHDFITKEIIIKYITDNNISAKIVGETIDLSKHKVLSEIKAATYHELEIKDVEGGLQARVIFDI